MNQIINREPETFGTGKAYGKTAVKIANCNMASALARVARNKKVA
ncbi:hypothetical protein [Methanoculleus sp.]|jgi:hypothetical protein|nr:hypothetical protein [Methanoculleus sp.]MDD2255476.1 hypothetical protein [Methanoculleus sp.]